MRVCRIDVRYVGSWYVATYPMSIDAGRNLLFASQMRMAKRGKGARMMMDQMDELQVPAKVS